MPVQSGERRGRYKRPSTRYAAAPSAPRRVAGAVRGGSAGGGARQARGGGDAREELERAVGADAVAGHSAAGGTVAGADGVEEAPVAREVQIARARHERGGADRRQRAVGVDRVAADGPARVTGVSELAVRRDGNPARGAEADGQRGGHEVEPAGAQPVRRDRAGSGLRD